MDLHVNTLTLSPIITLRLTLTLQPHHISNPTDPNHADPNSKLFP